MESINSQHCLLYTSNPELAELLKNPDENLEKLVPYLKKDPALDAMFHTTVVPTMLSGFSFAMYGARTSNRRRIVSVTRYGIGCSWIAISAFAIMVVAKFSPGRLE